MPAPGFVPFDPHAPLDVDALVAHTPEDNLARGMFLSDLQDLLRDGGHPVDGPSYIGFKQYPVREYIQLIAHVAAKLHPDVPLRQAIRTLGLAVYPAFVETMIGKAIFSIAGTDFRRVVALAQRAYSVSINQGEVRTRDVTDGHGFVEMRGIWAFADCYQLGVLEGAMVACGVEGEVWSRRISECDIDFELSWSATG